MVTIEPGTSHIINQAQMSQSYTSLSQIGNNQPLMFKVDREVRLADHLGKDVINNLEQEIPELKDLRSFVISCTNNSTSGGPKAPIASPARQQKHNRTIMDLFKCCFKG